MSKRKKRRGPQRSRDPHPSKSPKAKVLEEPNQLPPVWSFKLFDRGLKLPEGNAEDISFIQLAVKLKNFEGMSWGQLEANHDRCHSVPVKDFKKIARDRWSELKREDIDELYRLRSTGKERLWGMRDYRTFQVIWWDPEHEVCPARKKHT